MHDYVLREEPGLRGSLDTIDLIRIDRDYYRACIPGDEPRHSLCLFVTTDQQPPGRHARHRGGPEPRVPAVRRVRLTVVL